MEGIIEALQRFAIERPNQIALLGEEWGKGDAEGHQSCQLSYARLLAEVERAEQQIINSGCKRIALRAENGFDWAIADLAAMKANIILVPVPMFFSAAQVKHLLASARIDAVCGDWQDVLDDWNHKVKPISPIAGLPLYQYRPEQEAMADLPPLPAQTAKITFTSGSTGQPKGVCLSQVHLEQVANALSASLLASGTDIERHMVLPPLSTLLENVTGLYIPLLLGATSVIVRGEAVGLTGSSQFNGAVFAHALAKYQPQSLVVTPALLTALIRIAGQAPALIQPLRFVAVGGAKVSPALLQQAHQSGIPAYEGYGLSECGSVVSLNLPGAMKPDSCGRVLPHCQISIADDGEVMVAGSAMLGYAGETCSSEVIATGDLGYIDNQQFLHITGRKKNQLITAYGRNISPEWIESETQTIAGLEQLVVLGEGKDALAAVVFSSQPDLIEAGIERLNAGLPDYARIKHVVVSPDPLLSISGLMTSNGRPRRDAIADFFANELEPAYSSDTHSNISISMVVCQHDKRLS
ncbi:AMP-binding protein [Photobacterium sagamiensis]|uniref:AMP-binding protein n=1 Tax=Photobacterium sagamiensis TaxID=2910241 RepID=UPI003D136ED1